MKILFVIPNLMHGGAEKVLVNLVNNLDRSDFNVTVLCLFDVGVNKSSLAAHVEYKSVFNKNIKGNSYIFKFISPRVLYKLFVKDNYDIVISYLEGTTARIISGAPESTTKIAWIHTQFQDEKLAKTGYRTLDEAKNCYNKFNKIIAVSKDAMTSFVKYFGCEDKVKVLYNINDTRSIQEKSLEAVSDERIRDDNICITSIGKIVENKGFDRLLEAHVRLKNEGLDHQVLILGVGKQQKDLEKKVKEEGVEDSFLFLGYKTNPYKYVAKSDIYVCASHREGFSTAVTEALLVGTPVLSTKCSGAEELLGNDEFGMIVNNDNESIYNGLKALITDQSKLLKYRHNLNDGNLPFIKETVLKETYKMFDAVLGES